MDEPTSEAQIAEARLKQAIEDVAENVSVAGLKEAITEKITWIRRVYQIVVAICLCCAFYYTYGVIAEYAHRNYVDDVKLIDGQESLPLSNVTICADVAVNKTFVKANVTVPNTLAEKVANATRYEKTQFLDKFIRWISVTAIPGHVERHLVKYFRMLIDANPQMSYFTKFLKSAMTQCRDMLKTCQFAGKIFDCCENALILIDENGVCYQIAVSHDISSQHISPSTRRQSVLGKSGGLTIEATLNLDDAPWFEDVSSGGFKVYVHPVAVTPLLSPLTAPSEAETFVKVTAHERILSRNCLPISSWPKVFDGGYYDPFGYVCISDKLEDIIHKFTSCFVPYMHYIPNSSAECSPETTYLVTNAILQGNAKDIFGISESDTGKYAKVTANLVANFENQVQGVSHNQIQCPARCRYWEYSSTASFVDLAKEKDFDKSVLYSRVHIFYTDFMYQQKEETLAVSIYLAFCNFGNVVGFYLGLSIVGIFEVIFWFANFFVAVARAYRSKRAQSQTRVGVRVKVKRVRRVQVAPI